MSKTKPISEIINAAFQRVKGAPLKGKNDLTILGGTVTAENLKTWLAAWIGDAPGRLRWRLYEYPHRFDAFDSTMVENALPQSYAYLERARLFGEEGDLDIRRDGNDMRWRFVGEKSFSVATPVSEKRDFWEGSEEDTTFLEVEENYYQWRGTDERVNSEWLGTLGMGNEGAYLKQLQYWREGRVEFVRFVGFEQGEAQNAKG